MEDERSTGAAPGEDSNPPTPQTIPRFLEILEHGDVDIEHGAIRWSSNFTFLTSVTYEETSIMAVYKPQRGERPLWDFPDGTLCNRERAAFVVSQMLGWSLVPPTLLRIGPRGYGSFQVFVEHDPEYHYFNFDASMTPQLMRMALFDVIVNNADRKGGHCIVDVNNHLWGIDHGITFHSAHKLRTVIWNFANQSIPDDLLKDIAALKDRLDDLDDPYRCELDRLLNVPEVNAVRRRVDMLLSQKRYPTPGPGPNYPWPPV